MTGKTNEMIEAIDPLGIVSFLFGLLKWVATAIVGILVWIVRGQCDDVKKLREDFTKHERESEGKFAGMVAHQTTQSDDLKYLRAGIDKLTDFLMDKK